MQQLTILAIVSRIYEEEYGKNVYVCRANNALWIYTTCQNRKIKIVVVQHYQ